MIDLHARYPESQLEVLRSPMGVVLCVRHTPTDTAAIELQLPWASARLLYETLGAVLDADTEEFA